MADVKGYSMPDDLFYHKEHMWVKIEDGSATVGIDDFSTKLAGEISFIELPEEGEEVNQDQVIGTIETGKWMGKIFAPLSGEITEINEDAEDDPEVINEDPYNDGWLFKMTVADPGQADSLMQGEAAVKWLESEIAEHVK